MRLVHLRVGVDPRVDHEALDERIDDGGDGIHLAQSIIEAFLVRHVGALGYLVY